MEEIRYNSGIYANQWLKTSTETSTETSNLLCRFLYLNPNLLIISHNKIELLISIICKRLFHKIFLMEH
jgi:hypothetical protein